MKGIAHIFSHLFKKGGFPPVMPFALRRDTGPEVEFPLENLCVKLGGCAELRGKEFVKSCIMAGAGVVVPDGWGSAEYLKFIGLDILKLHREVKCVREIISANCDILVFDASDFSSVKDTGKLFDFLHTQAEIVNPCGRIVIIGSISETDDAVHRSIEAGLSGFIRAFAWEVGDRGITVHLVLVPSACESSLESLARFIASGRSSIITGQVWRISALKGWCDDEKINFLKPLEGRTAIVTGAAGGIGKACVMKLFQDGAKVMLVDKPGKEEMLRKLAEETDGIPVVTDLTWGNAPEYIAEKIKSLWGSIDVIVHNAGVYKEGTVKDIEPHIWKEAWSINLESAVRLTEALRSLISHGGTIIAIGSISGISGVYGQTCYSGSKSGLMEYVKAISSEFENKSITANAIAAGYIQTPLTETLPFWKKSMGKRFSSLRQGGIPEDIGNLVSFLAGRGGKILNGQIIRASGGHLIG